MSRSRRTFRPAPGTERCYLCRQVRTPDHVPHPPSQILYWLWDSHPLWRIYITALGIGVTCTLAGVFAAVRHLFTGS